MTLIQRRKSNNLA